MWKYAVKRFAQLIQYVGPPLTPAVKEKSFFQTSILYISTIFSKSDGVISQKASERAFPFDLNMFA